MKKIFIFALILLTGIYAFAGDAWNNHVGFGFRIPTGMAVSEYHGDTDWKLKMPFQTGLDISYTGVHMRSGFSVRGFMDYNLTTSNIGSINPKINDNVIGFNFDGALGLGWAPVRNDYLLLGFYGMAGIDFSTFTDVCIERNESQDKKKDSNYLKTIQRYSYTTFLVGGNATAIWTPTGNRFSIFGSATVGYNLPGLFESSTKITRNKAKDDDDDLDFYDEYYTTGTLKIIPTIGISWRF